jgi:hypothetical protein
MGFVLSPQRSLAVIMVVIVIVVMVVVMVMIAVAVVAPSPCIFQVATAALGLAAVFPMLAFRIVQLLFRFLHLPFAFVIAIAIQRSCRNCSAQERQNHKRRNKCLGFLEHASSSACFYILRLDAHTNPGG